MSDASEAELLLVSEPTGNEEKKTLFFFGQAGCLKLNSPVKTTENHNNHKKDDASSSSAKDSSAETSKQKEDEDEDNLLQKISEALKDETAQTLPVEKIDTSSLNLPQENSMKASEESCNDTDKNTHSKQDEKEKKEVLDPERLTNLRSKLMENIEQEEIKIVTKDSSASELNAETTSHNTVPKPKAFSIVPYDDDSMSSSSQTEMEIVAKEESEFEVELKVDKSASLVNDDSVVEQTENLSIEEPRAEVVEEKPHSHEDEKSEVSEIVSTIPTEDSTSKVSEENESESKIDELEQTPQDIIKDDLESPTIEANPMDSDVVEDKTEAVVTNDAAPTENLELNVSEEPESPSPCPQASDIKDEIKIDDLSSEHTSQDVIKENSEMKEVKDNSDEIIKMHENLSEDDSSALEAKQQIEPVEANETTGKCDEQTDKSQNFESSKTESFNTNDNVDSSSSTQDQLESLDYKNIEVSEKVEENENIQKPHAFDDSALEITDDDQEQINVLSPRIEESIAPVEVHASDDVRDSNEEVVGSDDKLVKVNVESTEEIAKESPEVVTSEIVQETDNAESATQLKSDVAESTEDFTLAESFTPQSPVDSKSEGEISLHAEEKLELTSEQQIEENEGEMDKLEEVSEVVESMIEDEIKEPNENVEESSASEDNEKVAEIVKDHEIHIHSTLSSEAPVIDQEKCVESQVTENNTDVKVNHESVELAANDLTSEESDVEVQVTAMSPQVDNSAKESTSRVEKVEEFESQEPEENAHIARTVNELPIENTLSICEQTTSEKMIEADEEPKHSQEDTIIQEIVKAKSPEPETEVQLLDSKIDSTEPTPESLDPAIAEAFEKEDEDEESEVDYDELPQENIDDQDNSDKNESDHESTEAVPVEEPICIKKRMEPLTDLEDMPSISTESAAVSPLIVQTTSISKPCILEVEEELVATSADKLSPKIEQTKPEIKPHSEEIKINTKPLDDLVKEEIAPALVTERMLEDSPAFQQPLVTRKRKISERKSVSESDSEGNIVTDSVAHDSSGDEDVVQKKKPKMRGKTTTPRKVLASRKAAATRKPVEEVKSEVTELEPLENVKILKKEDEPEQTLQNFKFDYDESEDIVAKVAAIKTMISDAGPKKESMSDNSDDEVARKAGSKLSRKTRGRVSKRKEADSSSDDDSVKNANKADSKRSKTQDDSKDSTTPKKKRETGPKGLLKYIDTSLVIDTTENEAPVRQSRRIAQQKVREETERRQMEEKLLKQMKAEAEKKKKGPNDESEEEDDDGGEDYQKEESSGDDESFKGSRRKKKSKIKPSDKPWQTSSSHSEHSESEEYMEHVPSDPGSPLFKSDHEFSPESDDDDATQVQPLKRARTAKKLETVASSDEGEDINPNHACQVCQKTDSPEWILLCDNCDCGYHCSCLKPIIFLIPSGNWYCPLCCHKKLISNLSDQLNDLDTMIHNIETVELRKQRQKLAEINEQNILQERRKNRAEKSRERSRSKESSGSSEDNSSEDAPLKDYFYKLRKRNQTAAPSYRFNEYDDLINSAIRRDEMAETVKGAGNLGRGKDILTIIEAGNEEVNENEEVEKQAEEENIEEGKKAEEAESSGSDVVRTKKSVKRKKKNRKLNNLDVSSEEERGSDEDFKGTSSSDSEVDEEDLSMSSVSESSLDLPSKKSKGRNVRISTRNREKRFDRKFINDGDSDSDDEPLIKTKRAKKKNDSDEEDFDANDEDDEDGSLAEEIDSEDLCDDTDTSDSSESNWPKKKKKRVASYDQKPRKAPKKNDNNEDKAFRAGISKKKALKKSDNESEASASGNEKGRRKTRGKKLLYLIEDDLDSDESDGIKPGVKRPETPPEEREMFVKKQEEIKRMLAAKDTEAAKKLAAPTIAPIHFAIEKPRTPSPLPFPNEPASLSTIPKNVIESAKALDTDYNRIKPILGGQTRGSDGNLQPMNEEELAKMMEEEDFAQHQLKLAGEAIARKKLLDLEAKEEEFAAYSKVVREKDWPPQLPPQVESKKRSRKSKSSEKSNEEFPGYSKIPPSVPPMLSSNLSQHPKPPQLMSQPPHLQHPKQMQPQQTLLANLMQQHPMQQQPPPYHLGPPSLTNDRPSVLSTFLSRPDMHPQHLKIHQPIPPEAFNSKIQSSQAYEEDEKKKGRRKKFTPLRTDLVEGNISKLAKLDPPTVIQSPINSSAERSEDKNKVPRADHVKLAVAAPPQIFNPATNPTPSVITRLLQPQQRPPGPFAQGFQEIGLPNADNPNLRMYPTPDEMKNASPSKARSNLPPTPNIGSNLPQSSFGENPFVPRNIHPLYRGPPGYGIPPHARLPPYPFHHLHPNLRPGEYPPYNIPPQFSYYAPPAHSRQPSQASVVSLNHGAAQQAAGSEDISNSIRNANNSDEPSETSEFGGLVSYFSSQQELD